MAAEATTPVDEITGLPLPLILPDNFKPSGDSQLENWHHHFHPWTAPELRSVGGRALRSVRVQLVPASIHNLGDNTYHALFKGPELPLTEDRQFFISVLACAGYVSRFGIDMRSRDPTQPVVIGDDQFARLRVVPEPKRITRSEVERFRTAFPEVPPRQAVRKLTVKHRRQAALSYEGFRYGYDPVKVFFKDYLLERHIDLTRRQMNRFQSEKDERRRRSMGDVILARAAESATLGFKAQYRALYAAGLLHPNIHCEPRQLVFNKLGNYAMRAELMPRLMEVVQQKAA